MKYFLLIFLTISFYSVHSQSTGLIHKIKSGEYQIEYDNQLLNVYFNVRPSGGFHNVTGLVLTDTEHVEIVRTLKKEIDHYPTGFRGKFLSVDIHPLHILTETHMGYHYDGQIVVEISKNKYSSTYEASISSVFSHEVAHHFLMKMKHRKETIELKKYLSALRRQDVSKNIPSFQVTFNTGYVNKYAYGSASEGYEVNEEICEIFSYLMAPRKYSNLKNFIRGNPNSLLAKKTNKVIDYLQLLDPSFTREYFYGNRTISNQITSANTLLKKANTSPNLSSDRVDETIPIIEIPTETITVSKTNTSQKESSTYKLSAANKAMLLSLNKESETSKKKKRKKGHVFKTVIGSIALVGVLTLAITSDYIDY